MKQYIEQIKQVLDQGGLIMDCYNLKAYFIMNNPASVENIIKCDAYCKQRLPEEYKYFLKYYDGGTLFKCDVAGFEFLSTQEIIDVNELQKGFFGEDWDNNVFLFCNLLGTGEYLGFRLYKNSNYEIIHCIMLDLPEEWKVIGNSFNTLIETIIREKGKEYWLF